MRFSFADVERTLALTYSIADNRRSAFSYRLKHLQKLGFPPGINTGRGRAATYNVGHLVLLGIALELNQLGLNPERAIHAIESDVAAVASAVSMAAGAGAPAGKFEFPVFLYCDPAALNDLMTETRDGDRAAATFFYAGIGQALESFRDWFTHGLKRMAFFSVSALLYDLATYSPRAGEDHIEQFYRAAEAWADPLIHNVNYPLDRPEQAYWDTVDQEEAHYGDDTQA